MPSPAQHNCPAMQPMRGGTEWPMALNWSSTMQRNRCCSTRPFARGIVDPCPPLHIYLCTAQQSHRLYHPLTKVCMVSRCSCRSRSRSLWKLGATAARAAPRSTLTDDAGRDRVCRTTKRKEGPCTSHMHAGRARSDQVVNSRIAIGSPSERFSAVRDTTMQDRRRHRPHHRMLRTRRLALGWLAHACRRRPSSSGAGLSGRREGEPS